MPYNGNGVFNVSLTLVPGADALAEDVNSVLADIAAGLSNVLTRDGQGPATANISFGGFQLKEVGTGSSPTDGANLNLLPSGTPLPWLGPVIPTGFILAYGQVLDQAAYGGIFAVFGTVFNTGGESGTQFRMPDLRGRLFAGLDNMGGTAASRLTTFGSSGTVLGATGGEQTHQLSVAELPSHAHGVNDPGHGHGLGDPGHFHSYVQAGGYANAFGGGGAGALTGTFGATSGVSGTGLSVAGAGTGISIQGTGSFIPHNNVQPTMLCNWIIKI